MTPAENPRDIDRNFRFVFFVKKANALPMIVENPASAVKRKAVRTVLVSSGMDKVYIALRSGAMYRVTIVVWQRGCFVVQKKSDRSI